MAGKNDFVIPGLPTESVAEATPPVPALVDETLPVVLVIFPDALPVTFTVIVQLEPGASVAPAPPRPIVEPFAAPPVMVPGVPPEVQTICGFGEDVLVMVAG